MKRPTKSPNTMRPYALYVAAYSIVVAMAPCSLLSQDSLLSQETNNDEQELGEYLRDIKPILAEKCFACHGALRQQSELRLDAISLIRRGGAGGEAIVPNKSSASMLIQAIRGVDGVPKMPPDGEGHLTDKEIAKIAAWIDNGAVAEEEPIPPDPRAHWAYKVPAKFEIPAGENPIDWYFQTVHRDAGLTPNHRATPPTLIRRASLDLIGLPLQRDEIISFVESDVKTGQRAYDSLIDELLASPHHGERWGRHWMDVWRYTDWFGLGNEVRYSQKHIWHWRDWIVESLNEDAGYDQMIVEMLAADEIAGDDPNKLRATGYLARNWYLFNRNFWLDDVVHHTSKGFLGITMNCNRCHDHKYDPISQAEYYQFRAFFEPHDVRIDASPGQLGIEKDGTPRVFDKDVTRPTYLFVRGSEEHPDESKQMHPIPPAVLPPIDDVQPIDLPVLAYYPSLAPARIAAQIARRVAEREKADQNTVDAEQRLNSAVARLEAFSKQSEDGEKSHNSAVVHDDFASERPDVWTVTGGTTEYRDDHVVHTNLSGGQHRFEAKFSPPSDFVARLKLIARSGSTQSIGMAFDRVDGDAIGVYLSPPSRFVSMYQIVNGKETYPARKTLTLKNNQMYELTFAIQGQLLNVWLDDEFAFAHRLVTPRKMGGFAITNYQAVAEYSEFSLSTLDPSLQLAADTAAGKGIGPPTGLVTKETLQLGVNGARRQVDVARNAARRIGLDLNSFQLRAQAEQIKYGLADGELEAAATQAATAERKLIHWDAAATVEVAKEKLAAEQAKANNEAELKNVQEAFNKSKEAFDLAAGNLDKPSVEYSVIGPMFPKQSSGRRLALARWIADRDNPLTARVAVNHIWLRHFGTPLVDSMFDFGLRTPSPRHQALLDHLASEFMEHGWSMKYLHATICKSNLYQMDSAVGDREANRKLDPDNHDMWRMNTRRMEYEVIRDSLLHTANRLDKTLGGAALPTAEAEQAKGVRRTLYYRHARDDKIRMSRQFDDPSVEECYRRHATIVPQQSLVLANSEFVNIQVKAVATLLNTRLEEENIVTNSAFVEQAFYAVLGRLPTPEELKVATSALEQIAAKLPGENAHLKAKEHLIHILFMHNDFITIR